MLKAAQDEEGDGQIGGQDLAGVVLGRHGHQHAQAHQQVAEDAQHQGVLEGEGALGGGHLDGVGPQQPVGQIHLSEPGAAGGHQQRAGEVGQIDNEPAAQHPGQSAAPVQQGGDHQAVAGEQLGPHEDDHAQAEGEEEGADHLGDARVVHAAHGGVGGGAPQGDEHAGQDA